MKTITKDAVQSRLEALNRTLGYYDQPCALKLSDEWKGIEVIQVIDGIIHHPFGHDVYSKKELYYIINFALRAIQLDRLNGADSGQYWPSIKFFNLDGVRA